MRKYSSISVEYSEGVKWIYLNRPDKLNSLNRVMMDEIIDAVKNSGDAWAYVFSGKGKVFSAGIDLRELSESKNELESGGLFEKLSQMVNTILYLDKPVIIALNGSAYGGGAEFIWLGDIVIAPKNIKIGWLEARWGLIPPLLPVLGVPSFGLMKTQFLAYTSGVITSEEAYEKGIISVLVQSGEELKTKVNEVLQLLKSNSPDAFISLKRYFRMIKGVDLTSYGVSELIRLGRDLRVVDRAKRFIQEKKYPEYDWG